ncbi:MAG: hypothetical protein ACOX0W_04490 [Sphaerochaetaceae bacterium]
MKKILVMILLVSVVLVSVFAEQVGTGDISVYGKIRAAAPAFSVTRNRDGDRFDLIMLMFQPDRSMVLLLGLGSLRQLINLILVVIHWHIT